MEPLYVIQVFVDGAWMRLRGVEGGPFARRRHAEQIATARAAARRTSVTSTEGCPHRVVELASGQVGSTASVVVLVLVAAAIVVGVLGLELQHLVEQLGNALQHAGGGQ